MLIAEKEPPGHARPNGTFNGPPWDNCGLRVSIDTLKCVVVIHALARKSLPTLELLLEPRQGLLLR